MASVKNPFYKSAVERLHKDASAGRTQYDFYPMLAQIIPYMSYADVILANMEVIVANPQYPDRLTFNAPKQIQGPSGYRCGHGDQRDQLF